jgi:succinate dehydrogenase/fumarate reductase iron-sulfur protein
MTQSELMIEILRSDEGKSYSKKYKVPIVPQMTVLDALQYIREQLDGTLAFNYSCQKQRCGSCAMKIGDKISLACYTPVRNGLRIAPLPGFEVTKDLVVDWKPYEGRMLDLLPGTEEISSGKAEDRELSESASTCIRCFSCVGACPTVDVTHTSGFAGPAISVMLASFIDRTIVSKDYLSSIEDANLEYCTRCYACNSVCPADINIVKCIQELQKISGSTDPKAKRRNEMVRGYLF